MEGRAKKKERLRGRGGGEGVADLPVEICLMQGCQQRLQLEINQNAKGAALKFQDCVI